MKSKKEVVVYWSPVWDLSSDISFDIYYHEPISIIKEILTNRVKERHKNFVECPAFIDTLKNTYVIYSQTEIDLSIQVDNNNQVCAFGFTNTEPSRLGGRLSHYPTLKNQFLVQVDMSLCFFSEEPLVVSSNSPFFHQVPHLNYGALVPGKYDIGKWFRPINLEYNLWEGVNRLKIDAGEPLAYFSFETESQIIFRRFNMNKRLLGIAHQMASYKDNAMWKSLNFRYKKFEESSIRDLVLKEIKESLI